MGCSASKTQDVSLGLRLEWDDLFETLGITPDDLDDDVFAREMVRVIAKS